MNSGIRDQVGLEFSHIDVQSTIESERGSQRGDNLSNKSVQVGIGGPLNVEISSADIVDSFVIEHDCDISVFQKRVSGQHRVVWLYYSGGDLWGWINCESELGFLSVID